MLAAMRRVSSRVIRLVAEKCDAAIMSEIGGEAEVRDLRLKRRRHRIRRFGLPALDALLCRSKAGRYQL